MSTHTVNEAQPSGNPVGHGSPISGTRAFTEAKNGFKTSEFYVMVVFVAGVLFATYADEDSLSRDDGWLFAAIVVVGYVVSRGLAKLATRQPKEGGAR
jgi:hypothetical protein